MSKGTLVWRERESREPNEREQGAKCLRHLVPLRTPSFLCVFSFWVRLLQTLPTFNTKKRVSTAQYDIENKESLLSSSSRCHETPLRKLDCGNVGGRRLPVFSRVTEQLSSSLFCPSRFFPPANRSSEFVFLEAHTALTTFDHNKDQKLSKEPTESYPHRPCQKKEELVLTHRPLQKDWSWGRRRHISGSPFGYGSKLNHQGAKSWSWGRRRQPYLTISNLHFPFFHLLGEPPAKKSRRWGGGETKKTHFLSS